MKYNGVTIKKRENCNSWYTRKRIKGKQYIITGKTKMGCYENLKEFLKPQNLNSLTEHKTDMTFEQWYKKWLELYKQDVTDDTKRIYNTTYKKIPDEIKNQKLKKIKLEQLITFLNSIQTEKNKQRTRAYDLLKAIFQKAVDNELISSNPLIKIDKPKYIREHSNPLSFEEQKKLIQACKKIDNSDFLIFSMFQGTRKGETLGLTRKDIDFDNSNISITKAFKSSNKLGSTKNKQSVRLCPLFDNTVNLLEKYKNLNPDERIFNLSNKQVELIMKKINNEFKDRHVTIKDMRSTFITSCMYEEIPKPIIQSWVGHIIGSSVTENTYISYIPNQDKKFIELINKNRLHL